METKETYTLLIQKAFHLLSSQKGYLQIVVVNKLKTLGFSLAPASFSKILSNKPVGIQVLSRAAEGIEALVSKELGYAYDREDQEFKRDETVSEQELLVVPAYKVGKPNQYKDLEFLPDGRLSIPEKVNFIKQAKREVIEFGVRLNTFINYFKHRSSKEFRLPIQDLLARGIDFKIYLLDPTFPGTHLYFNDRAEVLPEEKQSPKRIEEIIQEFRILYREYDLGQFEGNFQVFTYKHIPYNHFLITDPSSPRAQMIVSHYLYGIKRADTPVIRFAKAADYDLFSRYMKSFRALTKKAKLILPE